MANNDPLWEVLAMMHWDERVGEALRRALKSYRRAGSPGVPLMALNYRKSFFKDRRKSKGKRTK